MEINKIAEGLEKVIQLGEKLLTTFDIEEVLRQVVKTLQELLNSDGATLYLIDPVEKLLISQVILSDRVEEIVLPVDNTSIAGYTALHQSSLNIPDVYADLTHIHRELKFNRAVDETYNYRTHNILTFPLVLKGEVMGVFQIVNKRDGNFSEADQRIIKNFAVLAGIALFNARLMARLMDHQKKNEDIVEHISDSVIIQDRNGNIISLNRRALERLPNGMPRREAIGKPTLEVFPALRNLESEIKKLIDQNLDKAFSGGKMPFVMLTVKNSRQLVEKVILILKERLEAPPDDKIIIDPPTD